MAQLRSLGGYAWQEHGPAAAYIALSRIDHTGIEGRVRDLQYDVMWVLILSLPVTTSCRCTLCSELPSDSGLTNEPVQQVKVLITMQR